MLFLSSSFREEDVNNSQPCEWKTKTSLDINNGQIRSTKKRDSLMSCYEGHSMYSDNELISQELFLISEFFLSVRCGHERWNIHFWKRKFYHNLI